MAADPRKLKDRVAEYWAKQKFAKAAEALEELVKVEPRVVEHAVKLGDAYRKAGEKEKAIGAYEKAADSYVKAGLLIKAIAVCKMILEIDASHTATQEKLAELNAQRTGRPVPVKKVEKPSGVAAVEAALREARVARQAQERPRAGREAADPKGAVPPSAEGPRREACEPTEEKPAEKAGEKSAGPAWRVSQKHAPIELDEAEPAPATGAKAIEIDEAEGTELELDIAAAPAKPTARIAPAPEPLDLEIAGEDAAGEDEGLEIDIDAGEPAPSKQLRPARPVPIQAAPKPPEPEPLDLSMDLGDDALAAALAEAEASVSGKAKPAPIKPAPAPGPDKRVPQAELEDRVDIEPASVSEPEETPLELAAPEAEDLALALSLEGPESAPPPPAAVEAAPASVVDPQALFGSFDEEEEGPGAEVIAFDESDDEEGEEVEFALGPRPGSAAAMDEAEPAIPPEPPAPPEFEPEPWPVGGDASHAPEPDSFLASPEEDGEPAPTPQAAPQDIPEIPLFSDLPREAFMELTTRMGFRRVAAGEEIIRIGDPGDRFFVIATGRVKVYKPGPDGKDITLATLEEGAFFGEMALLSGNPRSASVVAETDCDLLEISGALLAEMVQQYPAVAGALRKFYKQRLLSNVMNLSPLFQPFTRVERRQLVEKFKMREVGEGELVLKEGQIADGLYVVLAGQVEVRKNGQVLGPIHEGEIFGEVSLLNRAPAGASVVASRKSWLLRLPKPAFDEVIVTHPQILELVATLNEQQQRSVGMAI